MPNVLKCFNALCSSVSSFELNINFRKPGRPPKDPNKIAAQQSMMQVIPRAQTAAPSSRGMLLPGTAYGIAWERQGVGIRHLLSPPAIIYPGVPSLALKPLRSIL